MNPVTGNIIPGYEDASGGARGKRGEEIPPFGRVVAIADVYDAPCRSQRLQGALERGVLRRCAMRASPLIRKCSTRFSISLDVIGASRYPESE